MPGTVLDAGQRLLNKTDKNPSSWSYPVGDQDRMEASNFKYYKH